MGNPYYYRRQPIAHGNSTGKASDPSLGRSKNAVSVDLSLDHTPVGYARLIELLATALFVFLLFSGIAFVFLRPALLEGRSGIQREWYQLLQDVRARNDLLPGLLETVKMFQPVFARTADKMLESRAIIMRSHDPDAIMLSVDQLELHIKTLESMVKDNPEMLQHPSFRNHWDLFFKKSRKIILTRTRYNTHVQTYNDLIAVFPQSIFTSLFGYVRATEYPPPVSAGE